MAAETDERPRVQRRCDVCGIMDDHPRHVIYDLVPNPREAGKFIDIGPARHIDCCYAAGCNHDQHCDRVMAHVRDHGAKAKMVKGEQRLRGEDLQAHLQQYGDELAEMHAQAAEQRLRDEHGSERIDRYLAGGHLYEPEEVEQMRAAGVRTHRELREAGK